MGVSRGSSTQLVLHVMNTEQPKPRVLNGRLETHIINQCLETPPERNDTYQCPKAAQSKY